MGVRQDPSLIVRQAGRDVIPLLEAVDIADLVVHNAGYAAYANDRHGSFVEAEMGRFVRAVKWILAAQPTGRVLDLGTFIPVVPLALARLGYDVTIVERFGLYGPSFERELTSLANREALRVVDMDLSTEPLQGSFEVVLLMAVLEHLNGSPIELMRRIRGIVEGVLVVDVPNIAELGQRLRFLLGRSPLPDYATYLASGYPFSGHNREMTSSEVRHLLTETGFRAERLEVYDYIPSERLTSRGRWLRRAKRLLPADVGEVITALAR